MVERLIPIPVDVSIEFCTGSGVVDIETILKFEKKFSPFLPFDL